jgi:hypothetical protein
LLRRFGSLALVLIFLLCHRYSDYGVAVGAAAFAAVAPAAVFNDFTAGMPEPMAVSLVLLGIWLTPRHGFWSGVARVCSRDGTRGEPGCSAPASSWRGWSARPHVRGRWWLVWAGSVVMGIYAKFLDNTGNPIYPFYWSFLFVATGHLTRALVTAAQASLGIPLAIATAACVAGLAWSLWEAAALVSTARLRVWLCVWLCDVSQS